MNSLCWIRSVSIQKPPAPGAAQAGGQLQGPDNSRFNMREISLKNLVQSKFNTFITDTPV